MTESIFKMQVEWALCLTDFIPTGAISNAAKATLKFVLSLR